MYGRGPFKTLDIPIWNIVKFYLFGKEANPDRSHKSIFNANLRPKQTLKNMRGYF